MKIKNILLVTGILFLIQIDAAKAIPSATLIPLIGPIIGYILLLIISAVFFILSKIKKYRSILMVLGSSLVVFAAFAMSFGLFG